MSMTQGNQYRCDSADCDNTQFLTRDELGSDEGPRGWIMMTMNEPRDYGWSFREAKFSTVKHGPLDFCSIKCARDHISVASDKVSMMVSDGTAG